VEAYIGIQQDLLLAVTLPVFTRRARREVTSHPKFYFFDVGVWRAVRPRGPLDSEAEIGGAAAETLVFQELRALNDYQALGYALYTWRTRKGLEVDFVLYGERGLKAVEVKSGQRVRPEDLAGLRAFLDDYPAAQAWLVYGGRRAYAEGRIRVMPIAAFLRDLPTLL
jgi:predicted AAA+ superfamily ATPase